MSAGLTPPSARPVDGTHRRDAGQDRRSPCREPRSDDLAHIGGADGLDELEEGLHAAVKAIVILHEAGQEHQEQGRRERLMEFFADVSVYGQRRSIFALRARLTSPADEKAMRRELLHHGRGLLARAEDLVREIPKVVMARHLEAIGVTADAISRSKEALKDGIRRDENIRVAPKLNKGNKGRISM